MDLSLIESGKLTLSREPVSLVEIMLECRAMIEPQAKKRDIVMSFPQFEFPYVVSADRTRLKQVLINLLFNAVKYNRPNGTVAIECTTRRLDVIRVSIRDTGLGLAPEQLTQLFQPFNRLGQEASVEEGTGIGLVVSKRLIDLMGGNIGADSEVGVGSVGVEFARTHQPRVIVMDINLPGISGIEAMKILRADPSTAHIPIIALSANAMPRESNAGSTPAFSTI